MKRGRRLKDDELRQYLRSINKLGYPPRPPPARIPDLVGVDEPTDEDFVVSISQDFTKEDLNQVPPGWEDL